jgi:hypothetical protein
MRQKQQGDVLERLLKIMAEEKKKMDGGGGKRGKSDFVEGFAVVPRRIEGLAPQDCGHLHVAPITATSGLDAAGRPGRGRFCAYW